MCSGQMSTAAYLIKPGAAVKLPAVTGNKVWSVVSADYFGTGSRVIMFVLSADGAEYTVMVPMYDLMLEVLLQKA